jgi:hypothetical protein
MNAIRDIPKRTEIRIKLKRFIQKLKVENNALQPG